MYEIPSTADRDRGDRSVVPPCRWTGAHGTIAAEFKQKLEQIGVGNAATVKRKDGLVFSGGLSKLTDNSATIADRTLNVNVEIAYAEMVDVFAGAAGGKTWNGKAKISHSHRTSAIVLLAAGILIPVIIAASRNGHHSPVFVPAP